MQKRFLWIAAALALIAIPAVIGLVALRGDDSSSRRQAALVDAAKTSAEGSLTVDGIVPLGKAIEVESWSWGVTQSGSMAVLSGAGKSNFQDFHFVKTSDESSANLLKAAAIGQHIKLVTLSVRKAGENPQPYLIIRFTDVLISGVQQSNNAGGNAVPLEQVSLNYAKVEFEYKTQRADGSLVPGGQMMYDLRLQKGL